MKAAKIAAMGILVLSFFGCQDFFDLGEETITPKGLDSEQGQSSTTIQFDNSRNNVDVVIYDEVSRQREGSKVESIGAGQTSKKLNSMPNTDLTYYASYSINIAGVPVKYDPPSSQSVIAYKTAAGTNTIPVPTIAECVPDPAQALISDAYYVSIESTSSYGFQLMNGAIAIQTVNGDSSRNGYQTGIYRILASEMGENYIVQRAGTTVNDNSLRDALRTGLSNNNAVFESGRVYLFETDAAGLALKTDGVKLINRQSIGSTPQTPPVPPPAPVEEYPTLTNNVWKTDSIYVGESKTYRFAVQAGRRYYIQWNDSYNGDYQKTADVIVTAYFSIEPNLASGRQTVLFTGEDSGYTAAKPVIAQNDGYIFLTVSGYNYSSSGTYAIRYYNN